MKKPSSHKLLRQEKQQQQAEAPVPPLLVIVLEEIDRLLDKGPDEVYRLFMLPHVPGETSN